MNAGELCHRDVVVAYRETGLIDAARLMREHHVGSLVVVSERASDKLPIGMITDRDIVVAVVAKEMEPRKLLVGDVMSAGAHVAREQDDISDVLRMMREYGVRRVPVVSDRGALVGILAMDDVLEVFAQEMEASAQALRSERMREAHVRR